MKFAVNYSYSASLLLQAGRVDIDCWKLFEDEHFATEASSLRPVRVHFSFQAGSGDVFEKQRIIRTEKFLQMTPTQVVNTHLAVKGEPTPSEYFDSVSRDIEELCRLFGRERVIAENLFP